VRKLDRQAERCAAARADRVGRRDQKRAAEAIRNVPPLVVIRGLLHHPNVDVAGLVGAEALFTVRDRFSCGSFKKLVFIWLSTEQAFQVIWSARGYVCSIRLRRPRSPTPSAISKAPEPISAADALRSRRVARACMPAV